jgi:hypothetical protein
MLSAPPVSYFPAQEGCPLNTVLTSEPYHVGEPSVSPVLTIALPKFAGRVYYVPRPPGLHVWPCVCALRRRRRRCC